MVNRDSNSDQGSSDCDQDGLDGAQDGLDGAQDGLDGIGVNEIQCELVLTESQLILSASL